MYKGIYLIIHKFKDFAGPMEIPVRKRDDP